MTLTEPQFGVPVSQRAFVGAAGAVTAAAAAAGRVAAQPVGETPDVPAERDSLKAAKAAVKAVEKTILKISREVWDLPAVGLKEQEAMEVHIRELEAAGLKVTARKAGGRPVHVDCVFDGSDRPFTGDVPGGLGDDEGACGLAEDDFRRRYAVGTAQHRGERAFLSGIARAGNGPEGRSIPGNDERLGPDPTVRPTGRRPHYRRGATSPTRGFPAGTEINQALGLPPVAGARRSGHAPGADPRRPGGGTRRVPAAPARPPGSGPPG